MIYIKVVMRDEIDEPLINTEKLQDLIAFYKFPLFLAFLGIVLTGAAFISTIGKPAEEGIIFSSEASPSASLYIKVDIEGSVVKAGLYEFSEGERIEDAIKKAGGLTEKADLPWIEKNMNKAAKLSDGGKIYIPSLGEAKEGPLAVGKTENNLLGVTSKLININTASQAELEALPGVGPVTAGKIISGRPYGKLEELKEKKAVGQALFDKIKDKITI
ncbi:hypothetical protein A3J20_05595 [Candidatus Gottesmanbacteria bacterium RIFCSPLOWO2_02_FULL_42_29]|uniref:Soluble ligand binding domain-containing protein n=2 Tax=Candidatus Gottesmaniibacteriota TaxID=1752720 RepID=A0A1F6BJX3_9BACT|nr:MAG: Late competence protein ComEA [Candidatus Gottesmanbacteria bacterium GW2011_GWA2_42_18]KKS74690.1 MAG: Late competence protein ComEA [Candidatus Gottesmanbacteria bacterium GW2011_GWC2_42_8]OGG10705.1 MAG: hypothetical protein A2781_07290 [Candidatus Gottesmanbacteria bacterium RIFCSPHIGHO2_01_FULL_42_27]OGG20153.1 MAG: hypothetical protein A3E72_01185 [Candidatus Gottesmanbacteria bacterium RIFCSPHIGHO2_12_FULL_43_26]OGG34320.1 MAG: hypothetical protein A3G68_05115 [Candidatus Gottesm